jgi:hypothetical protein
VASIAIDHSFRIAWDVFGEKGASTLVRASAPVTRHDLYDLRAASGERFALSASTLGMAGREPVACGTGTTSFDLEALAPFLDATNDSIAARVGFAVCAPEAAGDAFARLWVRPALVGPGAVLESDDPSRSVVVLVRDVHAFAGDEAFRGEGGTYDFAGAAHRTSKVTRLVAHAVASRDAELTWDAVDISGAVIPFPTGRCIVDGRAAAEALVADGAGRIIEGVPDGASR